MTPRRSAAGGRKKSPPSGRRWALLLLGLLLFGGGLYLGLEWRRTQQGSPLGDDQPSAEREQAASRSGSKAGRRDGKRGEPVRKPATKAEGEPAAGDDASTRPVSATAGTLALVIDDLGRSVDDVDALSSLDVPISYSVLPYEERTAEVVARLRQRHREILCHLPMQPAGSNNPGPGALRAGMDEEAIATATRAALGRVPGAIGANNHMGSELTTDGAAMGSVLAVLQEQGLFFLDSRTSAQSVGYSLARSLGLPAAERDVFLDDDLDPAAIREQFDRFLQRAREKGAAIAIGHPHPATLSVLREEVPRAKEAGFTFVPVSFLLDRSGDPL